MTANLFAACRHNGSLVVRRVRLDATVQAAVAALFASQESDFRNGVDTEVDFNGTWNPDANELLTIDIPTEAEIFEETINANATSIQDINTSNFADEGIRALFTGTTVNGFTKVLVQRFTSMQVLQKKWALLQVGNAFRQLTEPAFSLDSTLTCVIEDSKIKFKSQQKLRSIINMQDIYKEATDQEVRDFATHETLEISDIDDFLGIADQTTRKLIRAISRSNTLNNYAVNDIYTAANRVGVTINVKNGKIVMPNTRADVKNLLRFLEDSLYEAALTGQRYITNSKRTV
ncbi:TPA: DUF4868 domain-containing protein [Legionella pneumophila]|nr:DUF4868 domain-containing protein [Legionella pneumophila]HAU1872258.1 DUF4868 domain-containing protein [Legionella pneumophila]